MEKNRGFTLIELIVVIAILGILAGIAIPRFMSATKEARKTTCTTNRVEIERLFPIETLIGASNVNLNEYDDELLAYAKTYAKANGGLLSDDGSTYTLCPNGGNYIIVNNRLACSIDEHNDSIENDEATASVYYSFTSDDTNEEVLINMASLISDIQSFLGNETSYELDGNNNLKGDYEDLLKEYTGDIGFYDLSEFKKSVHLDEDGNLYSLDYKISNVTYYVYANSGNVYKITEDGSDTLASSGYSKTASLNSETAMTDILETMGTQTFSSWKTDGEEVLYVEKLNY